MPNITYLTHEQHAKLQDDVRGIDFLANSEEVGRRVRTEWRHWDYIQNGESKQRKDYYQDPASHCNAVITTDLTKGGYHLEDLHIINIRFAFTGEKVVLEQTLSGLDLPTEKIADSDIYVDTD